MSGQDGDDLWSEEAIRESDVWADIRGLARQALGSFGWESEPASWGAPVALDGNGRG